MHSLHTRILLTALAMIQMAVEGCQTLQTGQLFHIKILLCNLKY